MPKKLKAIMETRTSRRSASREAVTKILKVSKTEVMEEPETLEILSDDDDDEVLASESSTKKKYRVCHRKSSDGNERDIIVIKSLTLGEPTLNLESWSEDLSPVQLEQQNKYQTEYQQMTKKIDDLLKATDAEIIYEGDSITAYETDNTIPPPSSSLNANAPVTKKPVSSTSQTSTSNTNGPNTVKSYSFVVDPRSGQVVGTVTPTAKPLPKVYRKRTRTMNNLLPQGPPAKIQKLAIENKEEAFKEECNSKPPNRVVARVRRHQDFLPKIIQKQRAETSDERCRRLEKQKWYYQRRKLARSKKNYNMNEIPLKPGQYNKDPSSIVTPSLIIIKPTEATSVGGIQPSEVGGTKLATTTVSKGTAKKSMAVVDLTADDGVSKSSADSKEVSFNKLQGKTFPSLVVVARPSLHPPSNSSATERNKLDYKVKSVLLHAPTKFTEWLIQQGLIRAEQTCIAHTQNKLKLGMYSDVSKFPFSGGYVWISECCPQRFVSVFSGSVFEASPHAPSVILKLIYHWSCQTNVQNVIQWVKVENLYVKGLNTWLRAVCTVSLHTHLPQLGGDGVRVEIGVISLGTTSQDGTQRQVKVEVLGILETESRKIRLRAVEPLCDHDRNYKKRFTKILEPLAPWVHPNSIIVTDLTVDKSTLQSMGFMNVHQSTASDGNQQIMDYLRRIVPRMFQNTLSLLSRQIIQQFLDELVWREWFGSTAAEAFDNLLLHLAEQTRVDSGQALVIRLNKVATNPFKNWTISHYLNRQCLNKPSIFEAPKRQRRKQIPKSGSPTDLLKPSKSMSPDFPEVMVPLEHYYYGSIDGVNINEEPIANIKCHVCKEEFTNNIELMKHYFKHAHNVASNYQCQYCLAGITIKENLDSHIMLQHPNTTRIENKYVCVICELKYDTIYTLGKHMSLEHAPSELPYQCGSCSFRCSSHREAIDHFHSMHSNQGIIQCPFCLKSTVLSSVRNINQLLHYYLQHLQKHQRKAVAKKCHKCSLWFIHNNGVKDHQKMHDTQRRKAGLKPWPVTKNAVMAPKSVKDVPEDENTDISNLVLDVPEDSNCKECDQPLNMPSHFPSIMYCENCEFVTCCKTTMDAHEDECKTFKLNLSNMKLPFIMFCVCGYSEKDGNLMAKHLAVCERNSAYPSMEAAKAATVTHSMLDVLGLIRRPEEPTAVDDSVDITSDNEVEMTEDKESEEKTDMVAEEDKKKEVADETEVGKESAPEKTNDVTEKERGEEGNSETLMEVDDDDDDNGSLPEKTNDDANEMSDSMVSADDDDDDEDNSNQVYEKNDSVNEKDSEVQKDVGETNDPVNHMESPKSTDDFEKPVGNELASENADVADKNKTILNQLPLETKELEQMINNVQERILSEGITENDDVEGLLKDIIDTECTKANDISEVMKAN